MRAFQVLIADPDPMLLAAYRILLVGQDVDLTAVSSASRCLDRARQQPPDLLIIDPELPGFHLDDFLPPVEPDGGRGGPLLLLTVRPELLQEEVPHTPGIAVVFKPISPALLAQIIGSVAQSTQAQRAICEA
jgi:CheY-like chemotaxis protein